MIVRRGALRASRALATRVLEHPNIAVEWNVTVDRFEGNAEGLLRAICRRAAKDGGSGQGAAADAGLSVRASAAFVSIGHEPNTGLLRGQLGTF